MLRTIIFILAVLPIFLMGQKTTLDFNEKNGFVADGYDVTTYFNGKPKEGNSKFTRLFKGTKFKFASQENLDLFNKNPEKYVPKYGGWCAYAMGKSGEKVNINPETFEIRGGELYLFYNAFFTNTLDKWTEEGANQLKKQADKNWDSIKFE